MKKTLQSVSKMSFEDFEHIIIDGRSSDGTTDYLKTYDAHQIHWQSEKDQGIYDAMNKGIQKANGLWCIFMNAGDCFQDQFDLSFLKDLSADVVYGNSEIIYADGFKRIMKAGPLEQLWQGMSFTHQAVFVKTELLKDNPFELSYKYCADFDQLFKLYLTKKNFQVMDQVVCSIEAGGISDSERHLATKEVWEINKKLNPDFAEDQFFKSKIRKGKYTLFVKSILPAKTRSWILKKKYQADQ
ncbi:MAG: glycosyltransferase [Crocinitomicaceae bacterium]|nr:glycosyltransferase [Crocinitomicaceae bacterium]